MTPRCRVAAARPAARGQRVFALIWLLVALPLASAAVLLLRRPADRPVGPLARRRGAAGRRSCSGCRCFFAAARPRRRGARAVDQHLCDLDPGRQLRRSTSACCSTRCRSCFVLLITGVGSLIHIYSVGYMEHDPDRRRFFALPQPVRRGDAAAGARQQLPAALRRLGGRRPRVVPADRLLVPQARPRPPRPRRRSW